MIKSGAPHAPADGAPAIPITRRDFCNGVMVGAGAALTAGCGPLRSIDADSASANPVWDGPSGVGEYRGSNGNTWRTTQAGHEIRDGGYAGDAAVYDTGEHYDLIIVGGGFAGLGALHAFRKERPGGKVLLLDNQEIFGGYAKANMFEVDGHRIAGAQASLNFLLPQSPSDRGGEIWQDLGFPNEVDFATREDGRSDIVFSASSSGPLYAGEQSGTTGYHFRTGGWVKDIWRDDLARMPWPEETKRALIALRNRKRLGAPEGAEARRLDGMTFADYATAEFGATPAALEFITTGMCITGPQISAYGARALPGLERYPADSPGAQFASRFVSFPSGNTVIARGLAKLAVPEAFTGSSAATAFGNLDASVLDRPGNLARIRTGATVYRTTERSGGKVEVLYARNGQRRRVTGDGVVLGIGAWVAKNIVPDLDAVHMQAFSQYLYSPMLMVNVALRNWRFLDRLGVSAARWFDGPGFYCNIRKPLVWRGEQLVPFHPDKPIVMTLYAPFPRPQLPLETQGGAARMTLYQTPYSEYERQFIAQLQEMFGPAGFNAGRDLAGLVLNRWGHAFVTPPPGFFFAADSEVAPIDIMTRPHGRIAFGQNGLEDWAGAAAAGRRAVQQLL